MAVESGPCRNNYNSGNRRLPGAKRLHQEILKRDGWRCQGCGCRHGLEVHHIQRRSQSGDDSESNMITLCSDCHRAIHA
jgi:5-methylcytosine-specific restriction endonuclease McrA